MERLVVVVLYDMRLKVLYGGRMVSILGISRMGTKYLALKDNGMIE